jgi:hypothetical protein
MGRKGNHERAARQDLQGSREKGEGISFPEKANRDFLCDYGNAKNLASNLKGSKSY